MDRRTFLAGTGAVLLTAPRASEAQQAAKIARIGYLANNLPCDKDCVTSVTSRAETS
jgi:hypothetical protein